MVWAEGCPFLVQRFHLPGGDAGAEPGHRLAHDLVGDSRRGPELCQLPVVLVAAQLLHQRLPRADVAAGQGVIQDAGQPGGAAVPHGKAPPGEAGAQPGRQVAGVLRRRRNGGGGKVPLPPGDAKEAAFPLPGDPQQAVRGVEGLDTGGAPLVFGLAGALEGELRQIQQVGEAGPGGQQQAVQLLPGQQVLQGDDALFALGHGFSLPSTGWSGGSAPPWASPVPCKTR